MLHHLVYRCLLSVFLLGVTCFTTAKADPVTFKLPEFMDGDKVGDSAGNPMDISGKPTWRIDQIWPADPLVAANYKPMIWVGDAWRGAYEFGHQPELKFDGGKATIGVRGDWGEGGTMPGAKIGVLVFIAPKDGHYTVTGSAKASIWQGDLAAVSFSVLMRDGKEDKVKRLRAISLAKDRDIVLEGIEADLKAGQELVLAPVITDNYTAANVEFSGLTVECK